jgi:branched-chain amino acid aminotransferase
MAICWINGEFVPKERASISLFDHGLLYGDGVFEGIRFYNNHAFRAEEHIKRLFDSAKTIMITIPYSPQELISAITQGIINYADDSGYIRIVITRGEGSLGISPATCHKSNVFIITDQLNMIETERLNSGAQIIVASTRRLSSDSLDPRIKSLNYLNHIMARMEASHANADEAILLNQQGNVTEGSTDNIFIVRNGCLMTPPVTDGALDGITRSIVIELAALLHIPFREQTLATYDLYTADECLLTGTGAELIPVRDIDGRQLSYCPGPVYQALNQAFKQLIKQESTESINKAVNQ